MTDQGRKVSSAIRSGIASAAVLGLAHYRNKIGAFGDEGPTGYAIYFLAFALFSIVFYWVDSIVDYALHHVRAVRKIVAGPENIEGDWINLTYEKQPTGQIVERFVGFLRIEFSNYNYVVSGADWHLNGQFSSSFGPSRVSFDGSEIVFRFQWHDAEGFGRISMHNNSGKPTGYDGWYLDNKTQEKVHLQGARVYYPWTARHRVHELARQKKIAFDYRKSHLKPALAQLPD